jgi:hypothetical protein
MTVNVKNYTRFRYGRVEHIDAHNRADGDYPNHSTRIMRATLNYWVI